VADEQEENYNIQSDAVTRIRMDIHSIKKDITVFGAVVNKLDVAVDKLHEISNSLNKVMAIHEQKFSDNDKMHDELEKQTMTKYKELQDDIRGIGTRLSVDVKEMVERIDRVETRIEAKLNTSVKAAIDKVEETDKKVAAIEKWRWIIMGGFVVIIWVLENANIGKIIKAFG
jgi:chromosome segregation ATPase